MTTHQPWYGAVIQQQLALRGWRQADLARELEVTEKHLSQLLTGRATMRVDMLERILSAFGLQLVIAAERPEN